MGKTEKKGKTITVSGVTFSADQVKSVTLAIDGRDIYIGEKEEKPRRVGFPGAEGS